MQSIVSKIFKMLQPEESRQPQDFSSDGQKAIAKLLEFTGCTDLRIDERRRVYAVKNGKAHWVMFKMDKSSFTIYGTAVMFKTSGRDMSWKDLTPELCDRLVLESLCGTFFGEFPRGVALIPMAESIPELMLKLDLAESIFISYKELGSAFAAAPNWVKLDYKEKFLA